MSGRLSFTSLNHSATFRRPNLATPQVHLQHLKSLNPALVWHATSLSPMKSRSEFQLRGYLSSTRPRLAIEREC